MRIKRTTYGEFNRRFGGLRRLRVNREECDIKSGGFLPVEYRTNVCYIKEKDCTYVALTLLGYIDLFGPMEKDPTIVIEFAGRVTSDDLVDKEFEHKDEIKAVLEELYNEWQEKRNSEKEED